MKSDLVKNLFLGLSGISLLLVILKVLELGAVVRWDWIVLFVPFLVGSLVVSIHFVAKAIIAYASLLQIVSILYADYQERMEGMNPQELYEEAEL